MKENNMNLRNYKLIESLRQWKSVSHVWLFVTLWTISVQFSAVQSLSHVRLFATPWITARQASLSITNSRSSLRLTSIESVMPPSHLILCCPLLLLPPIPPSIRVFSNESTLRMRRPKYWSFSFSIVRDYSPGQNTGWVTVPFSRGSSQPGNWTGVPCIEGEFFTSWLTGEAQDNKRFTFIFILGCAGFSFQCMGFSSCSTWA